MADRNDPRKPGLQGTLTEREQYLEAVLPATADAESVLQQFQELLRICEARKPSRLFLDLSAVTGKFSTLERYDLGLLGSRFAPHVSRVAVLTNAAIIDPEKFAVQVARNRGLTLDVFLDRAAALAWLLM